MGGGGLTFLADRDQLGAAAGRDWPGVGRRAAAEDCLVPVGAFGLQRVVDPVDTAVAELGVVDVTGEGAAEPVEVLLALRRYGGVVIAGGSAGQIQ